MYEQTFFQLWKIIEYNILLSIELTLHGGKLTDICELGTQYSGAMRSFIQSEIIFVGFEPTLVIESAM